MQLVFPLVDAAITGHERPDFLPAFLDALGEFPADAGDRRLREIGENLGIDEQDLFCGITHNHFASNPFRPS